MSKRKNFRDWYEDDEWVEEEKSEAFTKKDAKRYDKKKARIQKARKQKARQKNSYIS